MGKGLHTQKEMAKIGVTPTRGGVIPLNILFNISMPFFSRSWDEAMRIPTP